MILKGTKMRGPPAPPFPLKHGSVCLCNQYNSAVTAFDILRNYASLSEKSLQDLEDNIDDPANGVLLGSDAHNGFDKFKW
jgi:hypothetical protein